MSDAPSAPVRPPQRLPGWLVFLLASACLVIIIAGLKTAAPVTVPLLIALFVSMISLPLLNALQSWGLPPWLAVALTFVAVVSALALMGLMIGGSAAEFSAQVPKYRQRFSILSDQFQQWLAARNIPIEATPERIADWVLQAVTGTLQGLLKVLQNTLLVVLAVIFVLAEAINFPRKLEKAVGGSKNATLRFQKIRSEIQHYLGIKTMVSLATGGVIAGAMGLVGIDFPLLWGLIAFLLNFIPALGSLLAAVPPILVALVQPDLGLGGAVVVALIFLTVNVVIGNFIEPYLMGQGLGLSTLVVFSSLIFWGWVWGPVGMLVSVPLTMMLKILLENSKELQWLAILLGNTPRPLRIPGRGRRRSVRKLVEP